MANLILTHRQYEQGVERAVHLIQSEGKLPPEKQDEYDRLVVKLDEYENVYMPSRSGQPLYIWRQNRR